MDVPEEKSGQIAKRQAIQAIMRDSSLSAQEKQRKIQDVMANGASQEESNISDSNEPRTLSSEASNKVESKSKVAKAPQPSEDEVNEKKMNLEEKRNNNPNIVKSNNNASKSDTPNKVGADHISPSSRISSVSSASHEGRSPRVSTGSRAQDRGALKGRRSTAERVSNRPPRTSASAVRSSGTRDDILARKGERSGSLRSQLTGGSIRSNITEQSNSVHTAEHQMVVPPAAEVGHDEVSLAPQNISSSPSNNDNTATNQQTDNLWVESPMHHESMSLSPEMAIQPRPERASYAGLNYSGDVAMDGITAYVAPHHVQEETIDALGVVTESQLKEEDDRKKRRYLLYGVGIFVLLLLIVVVPVVITQTKGSGYVEIVNVTDAPSEAPSSSPTTGIFAELVSGLEQVYGDESIGEFFDAMGDMTSPQYQAATWVTTNAPIGSSGDRPRMISRYALAVFYFSTNGDEWEVCGRLSNDCTVANQWLTSENECDWFAVECKDPSSGDYSVTRLDFPPNRGDPRNIGGTLPFEISFLSSLTSFVLTRESLMGPFPDWSRLTSLKNVLVNYNNLSGSFPSFLISQNSLLGTLHLESNSFQGMLPSFSTSTSLSDLRLNNNEFTGSIPSEISNLESLSTLLLNNNDFVGNLPEELYSLTGLSSFHISNNTGLTGSISDAVGGLTNLVAFVASNTTMDGSLPEPLFSLPKLQRLVLDTGRFSGQLSNSFSNLSELESVLLHSNSFSGTIPTGFAELSYLNSLELYSNDLSGSVPEALCARRGDGWSDLKVLTVDQDKVSCTCCTN